MQAKEGRSGDRGGSTGTAATAGIRAVGCWLPASSSAITSYSFLPFFLLAGIEVDSAFFSTLFFVVALRVFNVFWFDHSPSEMEKTCCARFLFNTKLI